MTDEHSLRTGWIFSWQPYGSWEMNDYVIIHSVEAFWTVFEQHLPKPSVAFRTTTNYQRPRYLHDVERIRSFCMRREAIKELEWEDASNKGCFECNISNITSDEIDAMWETVLLLSIGETLGENVRAVRVIDRGKGKMVDTRFEIWCGEECKNVEKELETNIKNRTFTWKFFN